MQWGWNRREELSECRWNNQSLKGGKENEGERSRQAGMEGGGKLGARMITKVNLA